MKPESATLALEKIRTLAKTAYGAAPMGLTRDIAIAISEIERLAKEALEPEDESDESPIAAAL